MSEQVHRTVIQTSRVELTGWKDGDPDTCGCMLINFPDSALDEPPAQKMRAIWGAGLGGSLSHRIFLVERAQVLKYAQMRQKIPW